MSSDSNCYKNEWEKLETVTVCDIFDNPPMFNFRFGAGAARAGGVLRYGSGSIKMMQLLAAQAPAAQNCFTLINIWLVKYLSYLKKLFISFLYIIMVTLQCHYSLQKQ
jgi:hypothetical protein